MKLWGQFNEIAALWPLLKDQGEGYYLDVGALDGVTDSNTIQMERLGWKGICIEPHKTYYPRLVRNRPKAICLDVAAWFEDQEELAFYATAPGGWSRVGSPGKREVVAIYNVKGRRLDDILEEHNAPEPIDFMSLDVEGTEEYVLQGFNLERWMPRIAIVEDLSLKGEFDCLFGAAGYLPVKSWEQRIGGSNVIYCQETDDWRFIKERWIG